MPGQQTRVDVLVPPQSQAWMAQQPGVVDLQTAMNSMLQAAASALGPPYTQALQASAPGKVCCMMLHAELLCNSHVLPSAMRNALPVGSFSESGSFQGFFGLPIVALSRRLMLRSVLD